MIGFSKAMSPALVDNKFRQTPLKNWKKKKTMKISLHMEKKSVSPKFKAFKLFFDSLTQ